MNNNTVNQVAFLRTSREFPEDVEALTVELNKSYLEIAAAVNNRTIGIFPATKPAQTGDSYYINANKQQQSLRQVYTFTSTTAIAHGINTAQIDRIVSSYGQYTDGTNWYGLVSGSSVAIAGQLSFYLTSTQIMFVSGAGSPTPTKGQLVIEWLVQA